jgi:L-lactate dehydrogenase complex protein LldG
MTSSRDTILATLRRSLHVDQTDPARRAAVAQRIADAPTGVIPKRAQLPDEERIALFSRLAETAAATVERVASVADVPERVASYLRSHNLPQRLVHGTDPWLEALPWQTQQTLELKVGHAEGSEEAGLSRAFGAIAESGTLALVSGTDNPTTINFLPETHIVAVRAQDVAGDLETLIARLRQTYGKGALPRAVNLVTGPSRSGDIEQTLTLGAHGPRRLHILIVG